MLGVEVGQGGNQPILRNRFLETFPEQKKCKSCAIFPTSANFQRHNMKSISSTPKLKVCMKRNSSWEFAESYYVIGVEQRKQHSWISIIIITRSILQALSFVFLLPQPKKGGQSCSRGEPALQIFVVLPPASCFNDRIFTEPRAKGCSELGLS